MSLLRRAERRSTNSFGPFVPDYFLDGKIPPPRIGNAVGFAPNASGEFVTPDTAMRHSAVWRCVNLLASVVSMLTIDAYRGATDGVPQKITPRPQLLEKPGGPGTSRVEWFYAAMVSVLLHGNIYGKHGTRDPRTLYPNQIILQHPELVQIQVDGAAIFGYQLPGVGPAVDPVNMLHIRGYPAPGLPVGLSPIRHAAQTIGVPLASQGFGAEFFGAGGHPTGILETDQPLTSDQADEAVERFKERTLARGMGVTANGLKFHAVQVSPEESQFLATQKWGVNEICRVFGVPPELIGGDSGNSMTYANVSQRSLHLLVYAVQWWLTRFEEAFTDYLPRPQFSKFDSEALLRLDLPTLMSTLDTGIRAGILSPDEAREKLSRAPIPDGHGAEFLWPPYATRFEMTQDTAPTGVDDKPAGGGTTGTTADGSTP